jgi:3' terminal RNA ribose 2'-O-methyltransferase Hen1
VRSALARLAESDEVDESELDNAIAPEEAEAEEAGGDAQAPSAAAAAGTAAEVGEPERRASLALLRREAVLAALKDVGGKRVLDLGCGGGALLQALLHDRFFTEILGVDVSARALQYAARKLHLDRQPEMVARRLTLKQGSLTYTDASLKGFDAAVLMEVIEHVDPPRLSALEHAVFGAARPGAVVVTTPNAEYNVLYETLDAGRMRHRDHRFEWTRTQFADWAGRVGAKYGYTVEYRPVGDVDPEHGPSTQMAVFTMTVFTTAVFTTAAVIETRKEVTA